MPTATRRKMLVAAISASAASTMVAGSVSASAAGATGARGFDFLHGRWVVRHRKLNERLVGSTDWTEFPGTLEVRPFLGGLGNIDQNALEDPSGFFLATSIRVFTPSTQQWSIRWVDGRRTGLDKPVVGVFEGKVGRFYNDDFLERRPVRVRFTYEDVAIGRARWDQAFSTDGGRSWETNWTMDFARQAAR